MIVCLSEVADADEGQIMFVSRLRSYLIRMVFSHLKQGRECPPGYPPRNRVADNVRQ